MLYELLVSGGRFHAFEGSVTREAFIQIEEEKKRKALGQDQGDSKQKTAETVKIERFSFSKKSNILYTKLAN